MHEPDQVGTENKSEHPLDEKEHFCLFFYLALLKQNQIHTESYGSTDEPDQVGTENRSEHVNL